MQNNIATHSFRIDDAESYGVKEAIFLYNLRFWLQVNKDNNQNYYDGRYWALLKPEFFENHFPYFTPKQIKTIRKNLIEKNILLTGCFNKVKYDRTFSYSINEEWTTQQHDVYKKQNSAKLLKSPIRPNGPTGGTIKSHTQDQKVSPIQDNIIINNKGETPLDFLDFLKGKSKDEILLYENIINSFNEIFNKSIKHSNINNAKLIFDLIKNNKYSLEDFKKVFEVEEYKTRCDDKLIFRTLDHSVRFFNDSLGVDLDKLKQSKIYSKIDDFDTIKNEIETVLKNGTDKTDKSNLSEKTKNIVMILGGWHRVRQISFNQLPFKIREAMRSIIAEKENENEKQNIEVKKYLKPLKDVKRLEPEKIQSILDEFEIKI